jgi:hypothetical protein
MSRVSKIHNVNKFAVINFHKQRFYTNCVYVGPTYMCKDITSSVVWPATTVSNESSSSNAILNINTDLKLSPFHYSSF